MPVDYKEAVLAAYREKKEKGSLSPNLVQPTPGSLREECLILYRKQQSKRDLEILNLFFVDADPEKGYLKNIQNSPASKFKQLPKILQGGVESPGVRYIELIAWLIDFNPRPSSSYYIDSYKNNSLQNIIPDENGLAEFTEKNLCEKDPSETVKQSGEQTNTGWINEDRKNQFESPQKDFDVDPVTQVQTPIDPTNKKWKIKVTIMLCSLLFFTAVMYFIIKLSHQCMYWANDHYQACACDLKIENASIIAFDKERFQKLKKINKPDTLTNDAVGKVWYFGNSGNPEFYTYGGDHPVYTDRRLLPLSNYILNKYILSKKK